MPTTFASIAEAVTWLSPTLDGTAPGFDTEGFAREITTWRIVRDPAGELDHEQTRLVVRPEYAPAEDTGQAPPLFWEKVARFEARARASAGTDLDEARAEILARLNDELAVTLDTYEQLGTVTTADLDDLAGSHDWDEAGLAWDETEGGGHIRFLAWAPDPVDEDTPLVADHVVADRRRHHPSACPACGRAAALTRPDLAHYDGPAYCPSCWASAAPALLLPAAGGTSPAEALAAVITAQDAVNTFTALAGAARRVRDAAIQSATGADVPTSLLGRRAGLSQQIVHRIATRG